MDFAMASVGRDYTWRAYEAVTNDGYVLTMFRIVGDENGSIIEG